MLLTRFLTYLLLIVIIAIFAIGCDSGKSSYTLLSNGTGGGGGGGGTACSGTGTGSVQLQWDAPLLNNDGSPLTNLAGYKIYFGTASSLYTVSYDAGTQLSYTIVNLPACTYFVAVTAYNSDGYESDFSNECIYTVN